MIQTIADLVQNNEGMVTLAPIFRKAYLSLAAALGFYGIALVALTNPYLQRQVLYAHKLQTTWWHNINEPESLGFAKNQVTPFSLTTPDHETLYAWHILPIGLYARHESELSTQATGHVEDFTRTRSFELLKNDPEARLIISFHGNAGHIAQGQRDHAYRAYSSLDATRIHILAIDYRGYGYSTGTPTEQGLITDGIATVNWALNVAKIPASRIVIVGQSLGTAVSAAVAEHFAELGTDFSGIVLIAPFTDLPNLLTSYSIGGWIPILSPLRRTPALQSFFGRFVVDTWPTLERLKSFIRLSKTARLYLLHAYNDFEIPFSHSEVLWTQLVSSTLETAVSEDQMRTIAEENTVSKTNDESVKGTGFIGRDGFIRTWDMGTGRLIREEIVNTGGHNKIMKYAPVAIAIWKAFGLDTIDEQKDIWV